MFFNRYLKASTTSSVLIACYILPQKKGNVFSVIILTSFEDNFPMPCFYLRYKPLNKLLDNVGEHFLKFKTKNWAQVNDGQAGNLYQKKSC